MKRKVDHIDLNKHLTHQELLEYNKGVLGSEEMYRLELHLNECELCSEALEGIDHMKNAENVINSINESILPPKQQVTFPRSYYAIAASIALIAAVGFTFWMLNLGDDKSLAVNTVEEKAKEPIQKESDSEETISITNSDSLASDQSELGIPEENQQVERSDNKQELTPPPTQIAKADLAKSEPVTPANQENQGNISEDQIMADAELTEEVVLDTSILDVAENEGNGLAAPTPAAEERAVTSTMRAKKSAATPEPVPDQKEPEPIGGMSSYKSYLENNIVYPQAAIDNKVKGTVVLEVTISPSGAIKTITIVKGLGYGCDEEAKRLINEGPKWKPAAEGGSTIEATQQIKVRFKL